MAKEPLYLIDTGMHFNYKIYFRVVPPNMRSFALGVQWLLIRTLGGIPGPILFGTIIDLSCIQWQTRQCTGKRGSCWINDSDEMTLNVFLLCKLNFW